MSKLKLKEVKELQAKASQNAGTSTKQAIVDISRRITIVGTGTNKLWPKNEARTVGELLAKNFLAKGEAITIESYNANKIVEANKAAATTSKKETAK